MNSLPPPRQGSTPVPLAPPTPDVEAVNKRRRRLTVLAVAVAVGVGCAVAAYAVGRDDDPVTSVPDPSVVTAAPTTDVAVATTEASDTTQAVDSTEAPTTEVDTTVSLSTESASTEAATTEAPSTEPGSTEPVSTEPVATEPTTTAPPSTDPAPTDPTTTEAAVQPFPAGLDVLVASPDGIRLVNAGGDLVTGAPAGEVAYLLADGTIVSQQRRGRDTGDHASSATHIRRHGVGIEAIVATTPRGAWATLRGTSVSSSGDQLVTYSLDRGVGDDELMQLNLTQGTIRSIGTVDASTEPVALTEAAAIELGVPEALATGVSDVAAKGDLVLINRLADPAQPLPAILIDSRSGSPVIALVPIAGRASLT